MPKETLYDVRHPRWYNQPRDAALIGAQLTREQVTSVRKCSGDIVYAAGTLDVVSEPWWLFPWEQKDSMAYARRAIRHSVRRGAV